MKGEGRGGTGENGGINKEGETGGGGGTRREVVADVRQTQ